MTCATSVPILVFRGLSVLDLGSNKWRKLPESLCSLAAKRLLLCLRCQRNHRRRSFQTAVDRGLGLGPHVAQRLHGRSVVRRVRADQGRAGRGLVQAAEPGGGRVLQRAMRRHGTCRHRPLRPHHQAQGIYHAADSFVNLCLLLFRQGDCVFTLFICSPHFESYRQGSCFSLCAQDT